MACIIFSSVNCHMTFCASVIEFHDKLTDNYHCTTIGDPVILDSLINENNFDCFSRLVTVHFAVPNKEVTVTYVHTSG